mgnify:CR=1 FL=1
MSSLNPHAALVHTMVIASAIDAEMTDVELLRIGQLVDRMPAFDDYEPDDLTSDAEACAEVLASDGGVDAAIAQIKEALPGRLRETAYAFACEIVAADGHASQIRWRQPPYSAAHGPGTPASRFTRASGRCGTLAALSSERCQAIEIIRF